DAAMTLGAGAGDVGTVHCGSRIGGGELVMGAVTIGAIGRYRKARLHQPLAVDALQVVFNDMALRPLIPQGRLLSRAVAPGAEGRHIARVSRRIRIVFAKG